MRKRVLSVVWAVVLMGVLFVQAMAMEPLSASATPELSFDGTTAICSVTCRGENSRDDLDVTLTLYQGRNEVCSWSDSGTDRVSVSGECRVVSGKSYKLTVEYSVNGKAKTQESTSGVCP